MHDDTLVSVELEVNTGQQVAQSVDEHAPTARQACNPAGGVEHAPSDEHGIARHSLRVCKVLISTA